MWMRKEALSKPGKEVGSPRASHPRRKRKEKRRNAQEKGRRKSRKGKGKNKCGEAPNSEHLPSPERLPAAQGFGRRDFAHAGQIQTQNINSHGFDHLNIGFLNLVETWNLGFVI
jgi:hypothetical protein